MENYLTELNEENNSESETEEDVSKPEYREPIQLSLNLEFE